VPPVARAESEYVLIDRASTPLRQIKKAGGETTLALKQTAKAIDKIGTETQRKRIDRLASRMDNLAGASERMHTRVDRSVRRMSGTIDRNVSHASTTVERFQVQLTEMGRTNARARVGVDGVATARAEIAALRRDIRAFGRESAFARVRVSGGMGAAGGGARRGGAFVGTGGSGFFTSRTGLIAGGLVAALPYGQALGGAAGAFGGSAVGAGLGAGSVLAAGGAATATGLAAIVSVVAPAKKGLELVTKAQEKYTAAVADYGRTSKQAAAAKKDLDQAYSHAPRGARELLEQTRALKREWNTLTRGSQGDLLGLGATGTRRLRRAAPQLARDTRIVTRSTARAGEDFTGFLASPTVQRGLLEFSHLYADNVGTAERTTENLLRTFINIARASKPFFTEAVDWSEHWSKGWSDSTRDIDHTRSKIGEFVTDLKAWGRLGHEAFDITWHLLNIGRPAGTSGIVQLTGTLERWDSWVQDNPEKVDHFFRQSISSTGKLASGLVQVVKALHGLADDLTPIADRFSDIVTLAGQLGLLQPGALGITLGAYRGARGRGGGGGMGGVLPMGGGGPAGGAGGGGRSGGAGLPYTGGLVGAYGTYGIQRALGASRKGAAGTAGTRLLGSTGMAGGFARGGFGALRGAGRAAWPLALGFGLLDFASAEGNAGQRLGSAVNSGLFGIPDALGANLTPKFSPTGQERADKFLNRNVGNAGAIDAQMAHLRRLLDANETYKSRGLNLGAFTSALRGQGNSGGNILGHTGTRQVLRGAERTKVESEIRALRPAFDQADGAAGQRGAGDIINAFGIRQRGAGTVAARRGFGTDFAQAFRDRGREGRRELATQVGSWVEELQKGDKSSRRTADQLSRGVVGRFRAMGIQVRTVNEAIGSQTPRTWAEIETAISGASERALQSVHTNMTAIQQEAVGSLVAMGYSRGAAIGIVRSQEASNAAAGAKTRRGAIGSAINAATGTTGAMSGGVGGYTGSNAAGGGKARGGRVKGQGLADTVRFGDSMVAPGEAWIANRHTEQRIDTMLGQFGTTLAREIERETVPHGAPKRRALGGMARPGDVGGSWVTGDTDFEPSLLTALTRMAQSRATRIFVQSGRRSSDEQQALINKYGANNPNHPVAGLNGPHVQGIAADITPGREVFGRDAPRFGLGFTVPQEGWHVQLLNAAARSGALGNVSAALGGAGGGISLSKRRSGLGGAPGALADRAIGAYTAGLQRKLDSATGGAGGDLSGFGGGGSASANRSLSRRMMAAFGFGDDQWNPLNLLWTRESGFSAQARNPSSGAFGIPQALPPSKMGAAAVAGSPSAQIAWGLRYIKGRYGTPAGAWAHSQATGWYERGGKVSGVPWLGTGGDAVVRRPTLVGVGDQPGGSGPGETLSVRRRRNGPRARRSLSGGVSVIIENMPVHYAAKGDLRKTVRQELRQAFEDLADELENGDGDHDEASVLG
jgi:hypothetical protein